MLGIVIELDSVDGFIDITEGQGYIGYFLTSGFAYGSIPIQVSTLTYSQFEARGFSLDDEFDSDGIPFDAADGML